MKVGIVPCAGYGTRFKTKGWSKELAPILTKDGDWVPVMDFILERMKIGGCQRIIILLNSSKTDILKVYANQGYEFMFEDGTKDWFDYVQRTEVSPTDEIFIGYPDTIWFPKEYMGMLTEWDNFPIWNETPILVTFKVPDPQNFGTVVEKKGKFIVEDKPKKPKTKRIWGWIYCRGSHLSNLKRTMFKTGDFNIMNPLPNGEYFDVGTVDGYKKAQEYVSKT